MPRSSEHERSGALGMLKACVRVSDVARYLNCYRSTIQRLRDRYQATETVKDRRRFGQPKMAIDVKRQLTSIMYRRFYIDDIRSGRLLSGQTDSRAPRVICF